jgi:FixJ family two-component response regulator
MDAKNKPAREPLVSIVDDDSSVRRSTWRLLSSSGLRVETYASAEDFLRLAKLEKTSCLLLDLSLPGMSGLDLQKHLAQSGLRIPIVFLTARGGEEDERRALRAGANSFLRKPVGEEALLHAIRAALASSASSPHPGE